MTTEDQSLSSEALAILDDLQLAEERSRPPVSFGQEKLVIEQLRQPDLNGTTLVAESKSAIAPPDRAETEVALTEKSGGNVSSAEISPGSVDVGTLTESSNIAGADQEYETRALARPPNANHARIDKSRLWIPIEKRRRDKEHLRRVAELPCVICNRQPSQAHHLRFAQKRGMSQKVSDEFTVPLCGIHHGDLHRSKSEQDWWARQNVDPLPISSELWAKHHPNWISD